MAIVVIWSPLYWLDGGVKALTAIASVGTLVGVVLTRRALARILDASAERDILLAEQRRAVAELQASLATRETDLISLTEEITRQRAERGRLLDDLARSNQMYRELAAHFPAGSIALVRPDLTYIFADGQVVQGTGLSAESYEGQIVGANLDRATRDSILPSYAAAFAGESQRVALAVDGRHYDIRLAPIRAASGQIETVLAVSMDTTVEQQLTDELRASEERFRIAFNANPTPKIITRADNYQIIDANPAFAQLSGYSREETLGQTVEDLHLWLDETQLIETRAALAEGGQLLNAERQARMRDGQIVSLLLSVVPLTIDGVLCYLTVMVDQTARAQAEHILHESEERYRLITENSVDLIELLDLDHNRRIIYASPSHQGVYGFPANLFLDRPALETVHPEDDLIAARMWGELAVRGQTYGTIRLSFAAGAWRWIELTMRVMDTATRRLAVLVGRDVTERQKLQQQYLQAQKMESIGRLAGGVAHDFNNLLTAILGIAELARMGAEGQLKIDLDDILKAARRAVGVTRQLLTFARQQIIELRVIELNDLMVGTGRMLGRLIGADIELVILPTPDSVVIKADAGQIEQILVNLVINARDAMPTGGHLTIETAIIMLDESYVKMHAYVVPGPYVMLAVTDSGMGMSEEVQRHLFEPFFTTKERGKGTGLGLATVYGIIKQHQGYVWVYSELGVGTSVKVYLPQVDSELDIPLVLNDTRMPPGTETILIVEDEEQVRAFAVRVLTSLGYVVHQAGNGEEALDLAVKLAGSVTFDLLVTDVIMPRMGGKPLADKFAALFPTTRILFISGYTDNTITHAGVVDPDIMFLQKPFSSAGLAQKVRQVLDDAGLRGKG